MYDSTKNPLWAWQAIRAAGSFDREYSVKLELYLRATAEKIMSCALDVALGDTLSNTSIIAALGFEHHNRNHWNDYATQVIGVNIACMTQFFYLSPKILQDMKPYPKSHIYEYISKITHQWQGKSYDEDDYSSTGMALPETYIVQALDTAHREFVTKPVSISAVRKYEDKYKNIIDELCDSDVIGYLSRAHAQTHTKPDHTHSGDDRQTAP